MHKYIFNTSKRYTWVTLLVIVMGMLQTMLSQYLVKFVGYIIDYGLNFVGGKYDGGVFDFLFDGRFGAYGSLELVCALSIVMILCSLLSSFLSYSSCYVQMKGQRAISNRLRKNIYIRSVGKKLPYSKGDIMVLLSEDVYQIGAIFITTYPGVFNNIYTIIFTLLMLGSISPYLLITPLALTPVLIFFAVKYHKAAYVANAEYRSIDGQLKESVSNATSSLDNEKFSFFKSINRKHTQERKKLSYLGNKYTMILNVVKIMIYIISCTVAGILAINGQMLIGEYLIFTAFINTIYTQILAFINYLVSMKSAQPRIERVQQLMEVCLNEN